VDIRTDEGEVELGSLLWTLRRSPLTEEVRRRHEDYARQSLEHLLKNEVVARMEVVATIREQRDGIDLDIRLYSQDGSKAFDQKFGYAWKRTLD
jgi:phage gp46-like protein